MRTAPPVACCDDSLVLSVICSRGGCRGDNALLLTLTYGLSNCPLPQLCAGHIRVKNNRNILLKNLLDCAVGTVSWFLIG